MTPSIAVQLYTVRDALAKDFTGVVSQIAATGYAGVEPAGFPGTTATAAGKLFRDLGLQVPSAHTPMPVGDKKNEVIDTMHAIGSTRIISGKGPNDFASADAIRATCDLFNEADSVARQHGMTFGIHNHWWEFQKVADSGRYAYEIMLEHLAPTVFLEIDTYWVKTAGMDPVTVLKQVSTRAPVLHIKDGPCVQDQPMVAAGTGAMDFPGIAKATAETAQWWIVELDRCATDMMDAVKQSYRYLTSHNLARGKK